MVKRSLIETAFSADRPRAARPNCHAKRVIALLLRFAPWDLAIGQDRRRDYTSHAPSGRDDGTEQRSADGNDRAPRERARSRISAVREANVSFATLLARADVHPAISVDVAGGAAADQLDSGGAPQTRQSRSCGSATPQGRVRRHHLGR